MKKSLMLSLLLLLLMLADAAESGAQSGRGRPPETGSGKKVAAKETPTPTPTPETQTNDNTAADPGDPGEEVLKISADLVSFPVSVVDRQGRNIFDLQKEEFLIFEDGKPQEIAFFATTEQPFTVVLMLDISRSTRFKITDIQSVAIAFLDQLRPEDKVMVIAFAEEVFTLSAFTNDRDQLRRAIRGTRFRDGTSMYDAFKLTIERLKRISGRKAIVMFTDGVDTTSKKSHLQENLRDADELDPAWLKGARRVGITAGASTPEVLVNGVRERLMQLGASCVREMPGERETVMFRLPAALSAPRAQPIHADRVA